MQQNIDDKTVLLGERKRHTARPRGKHMLCYPRWMGYLPHQLGGGTYSGGGYQTLMEGGYLLWWGGT